MQTDCSPNLFGFQDLGQRKVVASFDGGMISSDAGGLLLREVALSSGYLREFAGCFSDFRDQRLVEHSVQELVSQKVMGLCLGYEDINDHDLLRYHPLFATLCGKADPSGQDRLHERDRGKACAGKSTLNRLEICQGFWQMTKTKKIVAEWTGIEKFFVKSFLKSYPRRPKGHAGPLALLEGPGGTDAVPGCAPRRGLRAFGPPAHPCALPRLAPVPIMRTRGLEPRRSFDTDGP